MGSKWDFFWKNLREMFEKPCEWETLELRCIFSLLGFQASHPSLHHLGGEWGEMGFRVETETDRSAPGVSFDCIPGQKDSHLPQKATFSPTELAPPGSRSNLSQSQSKECLSLPPGHLRLPQRKIHLSTAT